MTDRAKKSESSLSTRDDFGGDKISKFLSMVQLPPRVYLVDYPLVGINLENGIRTTCPKLDVPTGTQKILIPVSITYGKLTGKLQCGTHLTVDSKPEDRRLISDRVLLFHIDVEAKTYGIIDPNKAGRQRQAMLGALRQKLQRKLGYSFYLREDYKIVSIPQGSGVSVCAAVSHFTENRSISLLKECDKPTKEQLELLEQGPISP